MRIHKDNGSSSPPSLYHHHRRPGRRTRQSATLVMVAMLSACADGVTAPANDTPTMTTVGWNALARELVIANRTSPPQASRAYAYLSVGQYAAALAARGFRPGWPATSELENPQFGHMEAAIAAASAQLLAVVFPNQLTRITQELDSELARLRGRSATLSAIESGSEIGAAIAASLATRASTDGADVQWSGSTPNGAEFWNGPNPLLAAWGLVTPWLWNAGSELRAPPPPPFDSETFRDALAEVRHIADTRTARQLEIARFWADGAGTPTPPGHWNELAADLVRSTGMGELLAARTMAFVNVAMMDALIACWDSKYTYWVVRPYQADPGISTPIGQPPHPSYPSGHACSSGAAAGVLATLLAPHADELQRLAVEACDSRVYAGIHYRFDAEAGMEIGRKAAARTLERAEAMVRAEIARALGAGQVNHNQITE